MKKLITFFLIFMAASVAWAGNIPIPREISASDAFWQVSQSEARANIDPGYDRVRITMPIPREISASDAAWQTAVTNRQVQDATPERYYLPPVQYSAPPSNRFPVRPVYIRYPRQPVVSYPQFARVYPPQVFQPEFVSTPTPTTTTTSTTTTTVRSVHIAAQGKVTPLTMPIPIDVQQQSAMLARIQELEAIADAAEADALLWSGISCVAAIVILIVSGWMVKQEQKGDDHANKKNRN